MKRATAISVLSLGLVVATLARADWRPVNNLTGAPQDAWIQDAGYFSVHTNASTAYRLYDDPIGGSVVTAGQLSPGTSIKCSAIVGNSLRVYLLDQSIDEVTGSSSFAPETVSGCRATETLSAYGYGLDPTSQAFLSVGPGNFGSGWNVASNPNALPVITQGISARTVAGTDYALIPRTNADGWVFGVNGAVQVPPLVTTGAAVSRTEIYGTRDGGVRAISVGNDGGLLLSLQPSLSVADRFELGETDPYALRGVTLSEREGDQYGAGFGLLLVESPGMTLSNVYSAVPDPNAVGKYWVASTAQPPAPSSGHYEWVRCLEGRYCVVGSSTSSTGTRLQVYRNLTRPTVGTPGFVIREEETSTQKLTLGASDLDGDAVFVTWEPAAGSGTYLQTLRRDPGSVDGKTWEALPINRNLALCGMDHQDVLVDVVVSDGLASHVQRVSGGYIRVMHTPPGQPGSTAVIVQAGTAPVTRTLTFPDPSPCRPSLEVTPTEPVTPGQPTSIVLGDGGIVTVTFTPPTVLCTAGVDTYSIKAVDGPVKSDAGMATFDVRPWGLPDAPFNAGRVAFQDAGTTATYSTDATHSCAGGTFPGVDTRWTWTSSGFATSPGIFLSDGGALPSSGGITPAATVVAPACQAGRIDFQATNTTRGDGGLTGPVAGLTVFVSTTLEPLSGTLLLTADGGSGFVSGTLDVSGVQCQPNRTISGNVELYRKSDGGFVSDASVPVVPGPYALTAPGVCGGGLFEVRATAGDGTGTLGPVMVDVQLPVQPAGISDASVPEFRIACGDVARSQAMAFFGPGQCSTATVDWSSSGAVAIVPATGESVELVTTSSDFGGLIGLPVDITATATAESGTASTTARSVVTAAPFISVVHATDTPVASESRVLGVSVTLTNSTACDVSSVEWHETLEGMRWIEGSVTGPDGGMGAVLDGGVLVVPGLSLPAGQSITLRYSARPTLFGNPSPGGVATLRAIPISDAGGLTPGESTCGCQSASGAGTALFGLLAAALLRKRRVRGRS